MGIYNVGDKLVMEIKDITENGNYKITNKLYLCENKLDQLEVLDSDYINDNFGELQEEAFAAGLETAWELTKKIVLKAEDGGLNYDDFKAIFGVGDYMSVLRNYTPQKALEKLEAYEDRHIICLGQEVIYKPSDKKGIYLGNKDKDGRYLVWLENYPTPQYIPEHCLEKTGGSINIQQILKQIGGD